MVADIARMLGRDRKAAGADKRTPRGLMGKATTRNDLRPSAARITRTVLARVRELLYRMQGSADCRGHVKRATMWCKRTDPWLLKWDGAAQT